MARTMAEHKATEGPENPETAPDPDDPANATATGDEADTGNAPDLDAPANPTATEGKADAGNAPDLHDPANATAIADEANAGDAPDLDDPAGGDEADAAAGDETSQRPAPAGGPGAAATPNAGAPAEPPGAEAAPQDSAPETAAPEMPSSEVAAPEDALTGQTAPEPATPEDATAEVATPDDATAEVAAPEDSTIEETPPETAAPADASAEEAAAAETTTEENASEDASAEGAAAEEEAQGKEATGRRWIADPVLAVATVLVLVAGGCAAYFGWSWYRAAHDEGLAFSRARDVVLRSGEQAVQNLNTLDYRKVDQGLRTWEDSTTGDLHQQLVQGRAQFTAQVQLAKTVTTARVLDGAVTELDDRAGRAGMIVAVQITVTPPSGAPATKQSRMRAELTRTSGGWKLSALGQAPVGTTAGG